MASGIVPEPAEVGVSIGVHSKSIRIERTLGRRAKPQVPVKTFRRLAVRRIADSLASFVGIDPCASEEYLPQLTAPDNLASLLKVLTRTLPGSRLDDTLVFARRLNHLEALVDRDTNRLFN